MDVLMFNWIGNTSNDQWSANHISKCLLLYQNFVERWFFTAVVQDTGRPRTARTPIWEKGPLYAVGRNRCTDNCHCHRNVDKLSIAKSEELHFLFSESNCCSRMFIHRATCRVWTVVSLQEYDRSPIFQFGYAQRWSNRFMWMGVQYAQHAHMGLRQRTQNPTTSTTITLHF